ncbi:hypothetical protein PPERSA_01647 [Pseudocohnilembus persalinus]|uniref:Uncharacterized protein n=1 Tax=Pseudocohnilembus persalinus TaxID=266149 RepID=A0A0V0R0M5_PSEPJ|nr:hypothetical protein PPERSA_01647 [Pseudocohnilembus persalinus]|eukprot:KRX08102.1 hypothetical protein PPERSA_01647 [Pseudocohnilembus persalinus]
MEEKGEVESLNNIDQSSNQQPEQQTGGGAFYQCGVKNCTKQFAGKKKEETVRQELYPHIRDVHQDVFDLFDKKNMQQSEIMKQMARNYLKKSRREQKKNYYCKICPKNDSDEPPRFSQVENVHQRSGLEAHVKRQHPEFWETEEQKELQKLDYIKWMNQWCGYDGPAKTKGGRPNKKFIIEKYNQDKEESKTEYQLDESDEELFKNIGIDVQKNKQIGLEEFSKHLEISHELFNHKGEIEKLSEPQIPYNEEHLLSLFQLDEQQTIKFCNSSNNQYKNSQQIILKIQTFLYQKENLLHLLRNQKCEDENSYPVNCQSKISEVIRVCLEKTAIDIRQNGQILQDQSEQTQKIIQTFESVILSFVDFYESLKQQDIE